MKQIVCFGDSNTYGLEPRTGERYPWGTRWTSILNEKLGLHMFRVVEEGLCGRTTIFEDPLRSGRRGTQMLPAVLETHGPSEIIILMLGTNDCKQVYGATADLIARGAGKAIEQIKAYAKGSKILLISPIHLGEEVWREEFDPEFSRDSVEVSKKLAESLEKVARKEDVFFLDASLYAQPSSEDQEHMNAEGHRHLAQAVYEKVEAILSA